MKYLIIALTIFFNLNQLKIEFLSRGKINTNGGKPFKANSIDFKKSPKVYLQTSRFRFDRLTKLEKVERGFRYQDAVSGTDMDLYTTIFIPAALRKNGGKWMLMFDANTHRLVRMIYSKE